MVLVRDVKLPSFSLRAGEGGRGHLTSPICTGACTSFIPAYANSCTVKNTTQRVVLENPLENVFSIQ